jgi:long-chain acyl-CoA synthetase
VSLAEVRSEQFAEPRERRHDANIGYWSRAASERYPDHLAIIDLWGGLQRDVSYRALEARLERFAALCAELGLNPGDRLAMAIGNRFEFVEVMYGAMRAGIVPVPLNVKLGADALRYILRDSDCKAAVVDPDCNRDMVGVVEALGITRRLALGPAASSWPDYERALRAAPETFEPPAIAPDHPAFQPYTSGSTGRPKGVVLTHAGQLWWIRTLVKYWPIDPRARALTAVPLYHKNAMAGAIKPLLHVGGTVVLLPDFEPRRFLRALSHYRCTQAGAVPAVFTRLLQHRDLIESLDFSALASLKLGSAPVQEELMKAVKEAFGCEVGESYGLTEGGPVMIGPPLDGRNVPFGSCGVAWPEGEIKLIGLDGKEHPSDGELWVRNPGVTPGYHNLPQVNDERLVDGWLATGDLFHLDRNGFFYFRGRTDDMFKSGGETVYPKEVENLLLSHPAVYDACVVALAHPIKDRVPVAMVLLKEGDSATEEELKQWCLRNGPAYAHPRRIKMVESMPLSGAGKVDRNQVKAALEALYAREIAEQGAQ